MDYISFTVCNGQVIVRDGRGGITVSRVDGKRGSGRLRHVGSCNEAEIHAPRWRKYSLMFSTLGFSNVAAVCSVFSELSPFVQFVGRIMRVIDTRDRNSPSNQGSVVFHAGANIARRWEDFREFSDADQEFFDQLLPIEGLDFSTASEIAINPTGVRPRLPDVRGQDGITVQELPLLQNATAMEALQLLRQSGYTIEDIREAYEHQPLPTTRVRVRQSARSELDNQIKLLAGTILNGRGVNQEGHELDRSRQGRTNFVVTKARIDNLIRERIVNKDRSEFSMDDLNRAEAELGSIREEVEREFFNA